MRKFKILATSLLFVAAVVTGYKAWQNSHLTPEEALLKKNIAALANDETPLNWKIYDVYAESSSKWTCSPGGISACPAP